MRLDLSNIYNKTVCPVTVISVTELQARESRYDVGTTQRVGGGGVGRLSETKLSVI